MQAGAVFHCCSECRGLFSTKRLLSCHRQQCSGDVQHSDAEFFALDASIAKILPTLSENNRESMGIPPKLLKSERDSESIHSSTQGCSASEGGYNMISGQNDDTSIVRKSSRIASKRRKTTFTKSGIVYKDAGSVKEEDANGRQSPGPLTQASVVGIDTLISNKPLKPESEQSNSKQINQEPTGHILVAVPTTRRNSGELLVPMETDTEGRTEDSIPSLTKSRTASLDNRIELELELDEVTGQMNSKTANGKTVRTVRIGENVSQSSSVSPCSQKRKERPAGHSVEVEISGKDIANQHSLALDNLDSDNVAEISTKGIKSEPVISNTTSNDLKTIKKNPMSRADWRKQKADLEVKYKSYVSEMVSAVPKKNTKDGDVQRQVYQCPHCSFSSKLVGFFDRHIRGVHGEKEPHICEICGYKTSRKTNMTKHRKQHIKPYICDVCGSRHSCGKDLKRHYWKHTGEKPYKCDQCDYESRFHERLKIHKRAHTGEREVCGVEGCTYSSQYATSVKIHQSTVHGMGKLLECEFCAYTTLNPTSLYIHRKRHTDEKRYACSLCDFLGHTKQAVERHLVKHTKEKEFQCDRCDFSTGHHTAFRTHMMNHLGVRPFQCSMCSYNSITKQKVVRHITTKEQCRGASIIDLGIKLDMDISRFRIKAASEGEAVILETTEGPPGALSSEGHSEMIQGMDHTLEAGVEEVQAGDSKVVHVYPWEEVTETISAVDVLETACVEEPAETRDVKTSLILQECTLAAGEDGMQVLYIEPPQGDLTGSPEAQVYYDSEQSQQVITADSVT